MPVEIASEEVQDISDIRICFLYAWKSLKMEPVDQRSMQKGNNGGTLKAN